MKANIIVRSLLALSLAGTVLVACDKEEDKIIVSPSTLATPKASASTVSLTKEALASADSPLSLSWAKAEFGTALATPVYELLVRPTGSKADYAIFSPVAGALRYDFTAKQLNELVLETFQLPAGTATSFDFVLRSFPLGTVDKGGPTATTSAPLTLSLSGVQVEEPIIIPKEYKGTNFYFVGSVFPPANWAIESFDYPLFKDSPEATTYTYTGKFAAGGFKVKTQDKNTWNDDNGKAYGQTNGAVDNSGGSKDISVANAGYYTFSFSTSEFSLTAYTEDTNTTYNKMALIGTAVGGWDGDKVVLSKVTYDPHIWVAKRVTLVEGEFKFRANEDWSLSWGGAQDLFPASKIAGGDNIRVSAAQAGTYNVYFNDLTKHFLFELYRK